jgi:hypothetical protein
MNRSRHLVVMFCLSVLGGIVPGVAIAQSSATVTPSTSFHGTSASQTHATSAVTVAGTIQQVVSTQAEGSPRGLHLVLAGPQGIIDASVGPYLASDVKESLATGKQVQIAGTTQTFNGQSYFLVRELTIGDRQITIRDENGFLVHPRAEESNRTRQNQTVTKGDNQ